MKPIVPPEFPWKDHTKYTYPLGLDLGGVALLSGNSASEFDRAAGKIVVRGDLHAQIETALAKIGAVLHAAGLSLQDVVSVIQYVTPQAFASIPALAGILGSHGVSAAASHVVPVNRLMRRDALIEIEVIAARADRRMPVARASAAIRVFSEPDDVVLIGEGPAGDETPHDGSLDIEVRRTERLLKSAGMDWTNVARCRVLLASTHPSEVDEAVATLKERIPQIPVMPAVGMARLPRGSAQLSVEIAVSRGNAALLRAEHGGLVRRMGSLLVATGLQSPNPNSGLVEQVEEVYGSVLPGLLAGTGMGIEHVVQTVEWVTEDTLPDYRQTGATRRKLLREPFPVASGLVCSALPGNRKVSVDIVASSH